MNFFIVHLFYIWWFCKVIAIFSKAFKIANKSCFYRSLAFSCNREIITTDKMLDRKFWIYCRGTKILQINTYEIQIQAEFIHVFLLTHICRYLYFITFNLKNRHFCPPKCPRDKKRTKLYLIIEKKRVINHHEMQISLWWIYAHIESFQVCC